MYHLVHRLLTIQPRKNVGVGRSSSSAVLPHASRSGTRIGISLQHERRGEEKYLAPRLRTSIIMQTSRLAAAIYPLNLAPVQFLCLYHAVCIAGACTSEPFGLCGSTATAV